LRRAGRPQSAKDAGMLAVTRFSFGIAPFLADLLLAEIMLGDVMGVQLWAASVSMFDFLDRLALASEIDQLARDPRYAAVALYAKAFLSEGEAELALLDAASKIAPKTLPIVYRFALKLAEDGQPEKALEVVSQVGSSLETSSDKAVVNF